MTEKEVLERIERAKEENATELDLSNSEIRVVPPQIGQLKNLEVLLLTHNRLESIPPEVCELHNLRTLGLNLNLLRSVPRRICRLTNLVDLALQQNQLASIPPEIGQLTNLQVLRLNENRLPGVPAGVVQLTKLKELNLSSNELTSIPRELGQLTNLQWLYIDNNQLISVPAELGQLANLQTLSLEDNQLTHVPAELGQLTNLTRLDLDNNQLTSVPPELGQLTNLRELYLHVNRLSSVAIKLGQLSNLQRLLLAENQLTSVPAELGQLTNLTRLDLEDNPDLKSPPPEVVGQGTKAILAYLRGLEKGESRKWEAKLLVVGEGGVGKTELTKALRGKEFGGETATVGVEIQELEVKHPSEEGVVMRLNMWDFGGQEIQHATHQFFYSERALFVLAWNARENYEQAKLNQWLERIQGRASVRADEEEGIEGWRAPVLLVATHRDLWKPDIPYEELQRQFPGIRFLGMVAISNKPPRTGIEELRKVVTEAAADLPVMGMRWPKDWEEVEEELGRRKEKKESRMALSGLWGVMDEAGVSEGSRMTLARTLDSVGKIRIFMDDEELRETVVLDPGWLTGRIARVLKNEDAKGKAMCEHAILERKQWKVCWPEEDGGTWQLFVRMMRNFDLVYGLEDRPGEAWLVVQLLPYQLAEDSRKRLEELWGAFEGQKEIAMKFRLEQSIPPGIPTWFIAREHRFSTNLHWRLGVLLADDPKEPRHLGLVQSYPEKRYVEVKVRGPVPHNFFAVLRDGLEYTLGRFPGLGIKRRMPCPGHGGQACEHEFDLRQLERAVEADEPVVEIQCPESFKCVSVSGLLFGVHWSSQDDLIKRMDDLLKKRLEGTKEEILGEFAELRALVQRQFTYEYNRDQGLPESYCPNVFAVLPKEGQGWSKALFGQKMELRLFCQQPGCWHPALEGEAYEIRNPSEFLDGVGPYIAKLAKVIKYAAPVAGAAAGLYAGPIGGLMGAGFAEKLEKQVKLMEELAKKLCEEDRFVWADVLDDVGVKIVWKKGAELRALRAFLDEVDKEQHWGGLQKVLTPEGHWLWLCKYHAEEYKK